MLEPVNNRCLSFIGYPNTDDRNATKADKDPWNDVVDFDKLATIGLQQLLILRVIIITGKVTSIPISKHEPSDVSREIVAKNSYVADNVSDLEAGWLCRSRVLPEYHHREEAEEEPN